MPFPDNLSSTAFADVIGPADYVPESHAWSIRLHLAYARKLAQAERLNGFNVAACDELLAVLPRQFAPSMEGAE